jgi:hypothetical protein
MDLVASYGYAVAAPMSRTFPLDIGDIGTPRDIGAEVAPFQPIGLFLFFSFHMNFQ